MDNYDENIHSQLTDISEKEMLAVFTLMDMLKRKREATRLKIPIQTNNTPDKHGMEISNELISIKKRRCHSLHDVTMFRKNEPDFLNTDFNKFTKPMCEEGFINNDISSSHLSRSSSRLSMVLIDDGEEEDNQTIGSSIQSLSTSHSSTRQLLISNPKLQNDIRESAPLFKCPDCYQSSSSTHMTINHFNKRNTKQEKQILTDYQTRGFDEEDMIYLQSSFHSLVKEHSLPQTLRWVDQPTPFDLSTSYMSDSCARTRPWTKQKKVTITSNIPCFSVDSCLSVNSTKSTTDQRNILANIHKKSSCDIYTRQKRQTVNSNSNKQSLFGMHGTYQRDSFLTFNLKYRNHYLYVLKSLIHGFGVFTSETIQIGELIIEYVGEIIRSSVADLREHYSHDGNYMFRMDRDTIIDASRFGNISRFLNHSCSPNCSAKIIHKTNTRHIVIYAKRTIHPHEELTYDYKYDETSMKLKCLCQSENCSGCI